MKARESEAAEAATILNNEEKQKELRERTPLHVYILSGKTPITTPHQSHWAKIDSFQRDLEMDV